MTKTKKAVKDAGKKLISILSVLITVIGIIVFVITFFSFLAGVTGFAAPFLQQFHNASHQYPALAFLRYPDEWLALSVLFATSVILVNSWIKENTQFKIVRNLMLISVFAISSIQTELKYSAVLTLITFLIIGFVNFLIVNYFKLKGWENFHKPL